MSDALTQQAMTVSQCVDLVKTTLQSVIGEIRIRGEVSEFQKRSRGSLVFFSLKDEQSYLRCFMLDHELRVAIEDGMEIEVIGYPSLFKKNSGFHVRVRRIQIVGEGALQKQLEATKKKLEKEGLFAQERKRTLPRFPERIGIITSADAAAFTDVQRVLAHRWPLAELTLVPAQVQGAPSITSLVKAFGVMEQHVHPEVIVLTRGGGSLEDLQSFNSEDLARVIFSCPIPVVVGVGHERDWTIADLVADVRAATPSHAAELLAPNTTDVLLQIDATADQLEHVLQARVQRTSHALFQHSTLLFRSMDVHLEHFRNLLSSIRYAGQRILESTRVAGSRISETKQRLSRRMREQIFNRNEQLASLQKLVASYAPQNVLKRGYSITRSKGVIVRSSDDVSNHDILTTTFPDGDVTSEVTES